MNIPGVNTTPSPAPVPTPTPTPQPTFTPVQENISQPSPKPCPAPTNPDGSVYEVEYTNQPTQQIKGLLYDQINATAGLFNFNSFDEFTYIQNYGLAKALSDYYFGVMDAGNWGDEVYENSTESFKIKESSLSEEEQKEARLYAIELLRQRFEEDKAARPDYGDCKDYYNYGSPGDWIFTHPVTLGLDKALGEDSAYHQFMYEDVNNGEGMLSLLNIPYHYFHSADNIILNNNQESSDGVRENNFYDFLYFQSVYAIDENLNNKIAMLDELENNVDNPEEYARLFYIITDGTNFSADEVMEYKTAVENNEETKSLDAIIGRDYIKEDYAKNQIGTNLEFSINKTIGTELCKAFVPGGPLSAFGINVGVSLFDENTREGDSEYGRNVNIVATEAIRSFGLPFLPEVLTNGILGKLTTGARFGVIKSGILGKISDPAGLVSDTYDSGNNLYENISEGEDVGATDVLNLAVLPTSQIGLTIDGYKAGSSLTSDITSADADVVAYDIAQTVFNPVAQFGLITSFFKA